MYENEVLFPSIFFLNPQGIEDKHLFKTLKVETSPFGTIRKGILCTFEDYDYGNAIELNFEN